MKRVICVLTSVFVLSLVFAGSAQASVLLDDYSTDKSSSYVTYAWWTSPAATFARSGGELVPNRDVTGGPANTYGYYWNGGETLRPGDSVSVEIKLDYNFVTGNNIRYHDNNFVGLALAQSTSSTNPWRIMGLTDTDVQKGHTEGGGSTSAYFDLPDSNLHSLADPSKLTLTRGTGDNQNVITIAFAKIGSYGLSGTGTLTLSGVSASEGLYFGTCNYTSDYDSWGNHSTITNPAASWDNLTYVPEPGTLVPLAAGLVSLLAYAWRKRK
jgi:hypothetical protein